MFTLSFSSWTRAARLLTLGTYLAMAGVTDWGTVRHVLGVGHSKSTVDFKVPETLPRSIEVTPGEVVPDGASPLSASNHRSGGSGEKRVGVNEIRASIATSVSTLDSVDDESFRSDELAAQNPTVEKTRDRGRNNAASEEDIASGARENNKPFSVKNTKIASASHCSPENAVHGVAIKANGAYEANATAANPVAGDSIVDPSDDEVLSRQDQSREHVKELRTGPLGWLNTSAEQKLSASESKRMAETTVPGADRLQWWRINGKRLVSEVRGEKCVVGLQSGEPDDSRNWEKKDVSGGLATQTLASQSNGDLTTPGEDENRVLLHMVGEVERLSPLRASI